MAYVADPDGRLGYDPETGQFMWLKRVSRAVRAGTPCGSKHHTGYIVMRYGERQVRAHRLAWFIMTGNWPADQIDHINGVKDDNRFENLREATASENRCNVAKLATNRSGLKGVFWAKQRQLWGAAICKDRKQRIIGYYNTPEAAHEAYLEQMVLLHGAFAKAA